MRKVFLFVIAALLPVGAIMAQQQMPTLPNDPAVKVGKLDNGLTYYIRHNEKPAQRAEFYLATNVGAIQETPDQDGLAHFLEHMCFNGTKNFPDKGILNWLESIGASFGGNVNAATGVEETTYMLNNIPLVRPTVVDTCLLILHDYSHFVTNSPEEIDKERPVILEEKRSRNNASWRMFEKSLPYFYGDSKYATCTLIGSEENLKTFKPESLTNFYHTWYQPHNQAVIVVGDVDVDYVEATLKRIFADIPAAENPVAKEVVKVPVDEERVGILTDPEASNARVYVLSQSEAMPEEMNATAMGLMDDLLKGLITTAMSERLSEVTSSASAPFLDGFVGFELLCESVEATEGVVVLKDDNILDGFKAFWTEVERLKRYGLTSAEIARAKENILSGFERAANQADTRTNSEFVRPLLQHFFDNEAYMVPSEKHELAKSIFGMLGDDVINQAITQGGIIGDNLVVIYQGPEKEGIKTPAKEELLKVINDLKTAEISAPAQEEAQVALMDASSLKGSAVKKSGEAIYGATEWTLGNGVRVIALPTEHKKDQIIFDIFKPGGNSLIPTEDIVSFESNFYGSFSSYQGVAGFKQTQLDKALTGKRVSVSPYIGNIYNGVSGTSSVKDLESAFQLLYLYFTQPRFEKEDFDKAGSELKAVLPNAIQQPNFIFSQQLTKTLYGDNPRVSLLSMESVDKASLEAIEKNYRKLFADAAGAVMVIVGDIDLDTLKPLVEKYVGSLPKGKKAPKVKDMSPRLRNGEIINQFNQKMATPMSTVIQVYSGYKKTDAALSANIDAMSYILNMVYTENMREDEGGTYGASVAGECETLPYSTQIIQIYFNSKPEKCDRLRELASEGVKNLAENGPTDEQFSKTIENLKKNVPENRINNGYWRGCLTKWVKEGIDKDKEYEAAVSNVTKESIKATAKELLESGNMIEVVMNPEN